MIRETQTSSKTEAYKETSVILHCYTLTRDENRDWSYSEDANPNPNDGKRHRIRSFVIAHDDNPYPSVTKLKSMLTTAKLTSHSNIKNSKDYGEKLGEFCSKCLVTVKKECKAKFGWTLT